MSDPLAGALAFAALGVLFAGATLVLLLNPRSRSARWWVLFQLNLMVWLALQGWASATGRWPEAVHLVLASVHLLPASFLAFALSEGYGRSARLMALALLAGVVTLPLGAGLVEVPLRPLFVFAWHAGLWTLSSVLLYRARRAADLSAAADPRRGRIVILLLLVIGPISLVGWLLIGGRMWIYAMPLLMIWMQLLVFVGISHLRFYDIEVRARRTGALAAEAAQQERLAVVGELSASLAHEIRNPLTGVRSLAQRLAEEIVDEPKRRRYATVILEEVGRVERLVADLLGLARPADHATPPRTVSLPELLEDLALLVASRAEAGDVRLDVHAGRLSVVTVREPLAQALLNLLLNAIAHSPRGGTVTLAASRTAGGVLEIVVRDEGPGIPREERARVWDPFRSGSGGTGLGLAVVRRLAREHGWTAELRDRPAGGTEAALVLGPPDEAAGSPAERSPGTAVAP